MPPPGRMRGRRSTDVSLFDAVRSYTDVSATSFLVGTACVVGLIDVGCAIVLYGIVHRWSPSSWSPLAILENMWDNQSFTKDSADILLLVIARLSVLPAIAAMAVIKGKPPEAASPGVNASGRNGTPATATARKRSLWRRIYCCFRIGGNDNARGSDESRQPLLDLSSLEEGGDDASMLTLPLLPPSTDRPNGHHDASRTANNASTTGVPEEKTAGIGDSDGQVQGNGERLSSGVGDNQASVGGAGKEREEGEEAVNRAKALAERRKSVFLVLLFCVSTGMQVYTGVKCVRFRFTREIYEGVLMGLGVVWLNALVWALTQLVAEATMEQGFLDPALHPHRLYPISMPGHRCDVCQMVLKADDAKAWRCKVCDFDLCQSCYEKKDRRGMENALRGDKGVREEENLSTLEYFRRALGLARPQWHFFLLAFLCLALSNSARIALPNFQGGILDKVVNGDMEGFKSFIVLYVGLSAFTGAIGSIQRLCFRIAGVRMAIGARNKLFRGVILQDVAFFEGTASGKLTSRLSGDVNAMVSPCTYMLGTLFSNMLLLGGGMFMCFVTSWRLSMLAFTTVGPIYHITQRYAKWSRQLNVDIYVAYAEANGYATEALSNIRTVKAMSTEAQEMRKYDAATKVALDKGIKDSFGSAGTNFFSSYLDLGAGALILWYGGSLAMDGEDRMSAGRLITYQLYWNMINNSWQSLLGVVSSLTRAAGAAQRVFSLMDSLPDIDINSGIVIGEGDERNFLGEISVEGVEFTYQMRPNNKVLKGVDLHIPGGTTCALVGRSGSGKTTLVHMLLRFYDPKAGRITIDGVPLTDLHLRSLHRKMAIVAQDTQLFATSIYDNITYGLEKEEFTEADVFEAARMACAHDFITEFSDGYQTRVGERGTRLSGGQKQRVAIARALLRKPRILLLDEATSALDTESEASVQQALDTLMARGVGNTTVVLVAHRLSTVVNADNIAVLDKGRCIEQGTHDKLVAMGGVYSSLVARQISREANTLKQDSHGVPPNNAAEIDTLMDELEGKNKENGGESSASLSGQRLESRLESRNGRSGQGRGEARRRRGGGGRGRGRGDGEGGV